MCTFSANGYKTRNVVIHFVFYICLSVRRLVEGKICRKFPQCFVSSLSKKRSFLTSCMFLFVSLNGSSHVTLFSGGKNQETENKEGGWKKHTNKDKEEIK